jgi:hypothetical protein
MKQKVSFVTKKLAVITISSLFSFSHLSATDQAHGFFGLLYNVTEFPAPAFANPVKISSHNMSFVQQKNAFVIKKSGVYYASCLVTGNVVAINSKRMGLMAKDSSFPRGSITVNGDPVFSFALDQIGQGTQEIFPQIQRTVLSLKKGDRVRLKSQVCPGTFLQDEQNLLPDQIQYLSLRRIG